MNITFEQLNIMNKIITVLNGKEDLYKKINTRKTSIESFKFSISTNYRDDKGLFLVINDGEYIELFKNCTIDINSICSGELDEDVALDIIKTIVKYTGNSISFCCYDEIRNSFVRINNKVVDIYEALYLSLYNKNMFLLNSDRSNIIFTIEQNENGLFLVIRTYKSGYSADRTARIDIQKGALSALSVKEYAVKLCIPEISVQKIVDILEDCKIQILKKGIA